MSLLNMEQSPEFQKLTEEIYTSQLENDKGLREQLDERARQKMYQDVKYNVDFLYTALKLDHDEIFEKYARWLYQLLCPLMSYCSKERVRDIMVDHYELIRSCMEKVIQENKRPRLHRLLDSAVRATLDEFEAGVPSEFSQKKYEKEINQYLNCLLQSNTNRAMGLISEFVKRGIPLEDIYVEIVSESMSRVGELWHQNRILVDMEHYCTSITQMALAQLYPIVFGQERRDRTVLVACVGSELHEMGARTVADIFEYNGWDSIYLGAAVPADAIVSAVAAHSPDLAALSVTMPQHLPLCKDTVARLRNLYPELRIAVGGYAFSGTEIWKDWDIDVYTQDARELMKWAENILKTEN